MKNAEEEGFEPPLPLRVILFSRQTHSATLPLFHSLPLTYKTAVEIDCHSQKKAECHSPQTLT